MRYRILTLKIYGYKQQQIKNYFRICAVARPALYNRLFNGRSKKVMLALTCGISLVIVFSIYELYSIDCRLRTIW